MIASKRQMHATVTGFESRDGAGLADNTRHDDCAVRLERDADFLC